MHIHTHIHIHTHHMQIHYACKSHTYTHTNTRMHIDTQSPVRRQCTCCKRTPRQTQQRWSRWLFRWTCALLACCATASATIQGRRPAQMQRGSQMSNKRTCPHVWVTFLEIYCCRAPCHRPSLTWQRDGGGSEGHVQKVGQSYAYGIWCINRSYDQCSWRCQHQTHQPNRRLPVLEHCNQILCMTSVVLAVLLFGSAGMDLWHGP